MGAVTNLTKKEVANIQIDESLIFLDYGEASERFLAPTRGGGEFSATVTVRDIEFDGRTSKTAGMQSIDEQAASVKVTTLCMSQENLALAIPNCKIEEAEGETGTKAIENPACGVIPEEAYLKNVTMFCKTLGGTFKKITIKNPMHENGLNFKAAPKAEGELALELHAHSKIDGLNAPGNLWRVEDIKAMPTTTQTGTEAQTAVTPDNSTNTEE